MVSMRVYAYTRGMGVCASAYYHRARRVYTAAGAMGLSISTTRLWVVVGADTTTSQIVHDWRICGTLKSSAHLNTLPHFAPRAGRRIANSYNGYVDLYYRQNGESIGPP